jgi:integrase
MKSLGAAAELPDELRHSHALRHTCATELLRAGAKTADIGPVDAGDERLEAGVCGARRPNEGP